jgi:hypothetical protein
MQGHNGILGDCWSGMLVDVVFWLQLNFQFRCLIEWLKVTVLMSQSNRSAFV